MTDTPDNQNIPVPVTVTTPATGQGITVQETPVAVNTVSSDAHGGDSQNPSTQRNEDKTTSNAGQNESIAVSDKKQRVIKKDPKTGKFVKGNASGVNPYAERTAKFRSILATAVTTGDWRAIIEKTIEQAKQGDRHAREWISDRVVGPVTRMFEISGTGSVDAQQRFAEALGLNLTQQANAADMVPPSVINSLPASVSASLPASLSAPIVTSPMPVSPLPSDGVGCTNGCTNGDAAGEKHIQTFVDEEVR